MGFDEAFFNSPKADSLWLVVFKKGSISSLPVCAHFPIPQEVESISSTPEYGSSHHLPKEAMHHERSLIILRPPCCGKVQAR